MRKSLRPIAFITALLILATSGVGQATASPVREEGVQQIAPGPLPPEGFDALVTVYTVVESIPDHFEAMGDEDGAAQWLNTEFENKGWLGSCPDCAQTAATVRTDWEKCVRSTAYFILANITPARWLLMLLKVITQLDGAVPAVSAINEAINRSHQLQQDVAESLFDMFGDLGAAIAKVTSLDGIFKDCY